MSQQNKENEIERSEIRHDFEDFDVTFKHDDVSNEDFAEVIIEGRGNHRSAGGEYLENVVLASGVQALQSERFREKTRSTLAAQKALEELEKQSLKALKGEMDPAEVIAKAQNQEQAEKASSEQTGEPATGEQPPKEENNAQTQPEKAEKLPFQLDEKDENSDKRRRSYSKKSNSKAARRWRRMKGWQKGIIIFLIVLLLITAAAVLTVYSMHHSGKKQMMSANYGENFEDSIMYDGVEYIYNTDITSIAFMGVDRRTFGLKDDLVGTAGQNDVNMVVAVNIKTGDTTVIVIPRDTLVDVNKYSLAGDYMGTQRLQLCLSYAYGDGAVTSCDNAVASFQRILYGIPINTYVALNLDGVSVLNDAIGGVKLTCPNDYEDLYKKGEEITLHGDAAEDFIRKRALTLTGDSERRERQVAYVKAFVSQAAEVGLKNPSSLTEIYNIGKEYTVTNLTLSRSLYFGTSILSNASNVLSFDNVRSLRGSAHLDSAGYACTELDEEDTLKTILDVYYTALD